MKRALLICVSLCACAQPARWIHPTQPPQSFYADSTNCMQLVRSNSPTPNYMPEPVAVPGQRTTVADSFQEGYARAHNQSVAENAERERKQLYDHCLRSKGWYTVRP